MSEVQTDIQKIASDPKISAKVTANAGTGKTYVLTQRVLRLLLSGVHPGKILCLTYTKAAAAEMVSRISSQLQKWIVLEENDLIREIFTLTGEQPDKEQISRARQLFSRTIESTPPPRIQTIHSFCQEVLKRFPVESGIPPYFEVVEETTARELSAEARHRLLAKEGIPDEVNSAIDYFGNECSEFKFDKVIREIAANRSRFKETLHANGGKDALAGKVYALLNVPPGQSEQDIIADYFSHSLPNALKGCAIEEIHAAKDFEGAKEYFLTDKGEPRKNLEKKKGEAVVEVILREQQRILNTAEMIKSLRTAEFTAHTINIANEYIRLYEQVKTEKAVMDFDDLIFHTSELLTARSAAAWVLYKLDGGIDHILVDEAQDTSPGQWKIVLALADDFFSGDSGKNRNRSIFIVGDEKQSIYSFQGADPEALHEVAEYLRSKVTGSGAAWHDLPLNKSFRSVEAVLKTVDEIFSTPQRRSAVTPVNEIRHEITRAGEGGKVELWPLFAEKGDNEMIRWPMPGQFADYKSADQAMAEGIAAAIARWIKIDKRVIASKNRAILPSDIIVLLRRRGEAANLIVKNLKKHGIPVSGSDRLKITEHIAVQDLVALTAFALLPDDNLSLAAALRSPLFGLSEEELFELAHYRGKSQSLYHAIRNNPKFSHLAKELEEILNRADYVPVYEFYSYILDIKNGRKKFIARLGSEAGEILDEFLELCLNFEATNTSSLQSFLHWVCGGGSEIKRDLENGSGEVRVMTVHGSKGLQAPVVIIADASSVPDIDQEVFYHEGVLLAGKSAADNCGLLKRCREDASRKAYDEYLRLFYVALTRAADEIYIAGAEKKKTNRSFGQNWYEIADETLRRTGTVTEDGRVVYEIAQSKDVKEVEPEAKAGEKYILPGYMEVKIAAEEDKFEDISAGKQVVDSAKSRRGRKIHKAIEIIAHTAPKLREEKLSRMEPDIAAIIKRLLAGQKTAKFFSEAVMSEVPLIGKVGSRIISARIDKMLVTDNEVHIIDYKTSENPPQSVPEAHVEQLRAYALLVERKYPDKSVRAGLIWTETGRYDEVDLTPAGTGNISKARAI